MNRPPLIFLGLFAALALSWAGLVLAPQMQIGAQGQKTLQGTDTLYPARRPGDAQQGQAAYVSLGCVYCHSQQVQPAPLGSDFARGWGHRRSFAQDSLYDDPVQLGSMRIGPDLANVGQRFTNETFYLEFLYNPRMHHPGSTMPAFAFLFDQRKIAKTPSPAALKLPSPFAPPAGYEIIPTARARQLAAYLISLQSDAPLFEAPWPMRAPAPTNGAPATTNAQIDLSLAHAGVPPTPQGTNTAPPATKAPPASTNAPAK